MTEDMRRYPTGCEQSPKLNQKIEELEAKLHKWNVLVAQGCTPSGSEFHDSPENVALYLKERDADKDRIIKSQQARIRCLEGTSVCP
jgi:hypothetical protein